MTDSGDEIVVEKAIRIESATVSGPELTTRSFNIKGEGSTFYVYADEVAAGKLVVDVLNKSSLYNSANRQVPLDADEAVGTLKNKYTEIQFKIKLPFDASKWSLKRKPKG
ncbi:hypothetical protein EVAR_57617_1 [Eumeta japonica]|uniref:Uncharacterized protein n=1 Tax=Eumeta variegata TaxID=151549 RepID=A0A4C1XWG1_EUMVA|nr:hypothetical protein EVAR_57617_1 [Eumeta japonica]